MLFSGKDWFQFHTGSIKSCAAIVGHLLASKLVSIPYWFD